MALRDGHDAHEAAREFEQRQILHQHEERELVLLRTRQQGPHEQLIARPGGLYAHLWSLQNDWTRS